MSEHQCLHEADLAKMATVLEAVCSDVKDIKRSVVGNGKVGLVTQAELNKAAIKRLWWAIGGGSGFFGAVILAVKFLG